MKLRRWFLLPAWLWMAALFAAPLAIVLAYSFLTRGTYGGLEQPWTVESYQRLFDPLYLSIYLRSFVMAAVATGICLVLGFPAALFIARSSRHKHLYWQLVLLPFWTSFLVRTYAWLFLLRDTGLINSVLLALGISEAPLPMLYNNGAVLVGLVYGY
ncbi:MAG: ABC transporter permease, partial [Bryobacteraceae bacterium]